MKQIIKFLAIIYIFLIVGCSQELTEYGEIQLQRREKCPLIINNSRRKIISFTIQYQDKIGTVYGSTVKVLKPGEARELRNCQGSVFKIKGAVEVSSSNYRQHLLMEDIQ